MITLKPSGVSASGWLCRNNLDEIFTVFLTAIFTGRRYTVFVSCGTQSAAALSMPREFPDDEAAGNFSAGYGIGRATAEL